jgi:hypothetical protein
VSRTLVDKAKAGQVEVEDITRLARNPSAKNASLIATLAEQYGWRRHPCFPYVPLATWGEMVSKYCVGGFETLVEASKDRRMRPFAMGVIEDIPSDEALAAVLKIGWSEIDTPESDIEESMRLVKVLNLFGCTKIVSPNPAEILNFLHRLLRWSEDEVAIGTLMYALRWYGNESSLEIVRSAPVMSDHWEAARRAAIKAIQKRIRQT